MVRVTCLYRANTEQDNKAFECKYMCAPPPQTPSSEAGPGLNLDPRFLVLAGSTTRLIGKAAGIFQVLTQAQLWAALLGGGDR